MNKALGENKRGSDVEGKTFFKALHFRLLGWPALATIGKFRNEGFGSLKAHANANANPCFLMSHLIFTSFL